MYHMMMSSACTRNDHRRDRLGFVRSLVIVDRHEPVHERPRGDERHVTERTCAHLLLAYQPLAPEALRITNNRVELGILDGLEQTGRLAEIGGERLLDQHWKATLDARDDWIDVQVLVSGNDCRGHLGALQQFAMIGGDKIGPDPFGDELAAFRILLGHANPFDSGVAGRNFAPDKANAPSPDDRKADALSRPSHVGLPSCHGSPPSPRWRAADRRAR
jgi:hypothetical protein